MAHILPHFLPDRGEFVRERQYARLSLGQLGNLEVAGELDDQEQTFVERLSAKMHVSNVNQGGLAERTYVGQSAISMMLSRQYSPQQRTVVKLAKALGVAASFSQSRNSSFTRSKRLSMDRESVQVAVGPAYGGRDDQI